MIQDIYNRCLKHIFEWSLSRLFAIKLTFKYQTLFTQLSICEWII